jgi:tRNA threonylcarbamoyladenosine biosynthesis protein TsaE
MERTFDITHIHEVASELLSAHPNSRCFAFLAEMGAGKTTLIRALCDVLGVKDHVSSPTFSIINEYLIPSNGQKVFHMDWYRLKSAYDAIEAGVQDVLDEPNAYCFIEWPEIAPELLTPTTQRYRIEMTSEGLRTIKNC